MCVSVYTCIRVSYTFYIFHNNIPVNMKRHSTLLVIRKRKIKTIIITYHVCLKVKDL